MFQECEGGTAHVVVLVVPHDAQDVRGCTAGSGMGRRSARTANGRQRRVRAVSRKARRNTHRTHQTRGGLVGQQLLQLPHAVHVVWTVEDHPQSSDQQSVREGERRDRASERMQPLSPRQDPGMDVRLSRAVVRNAEGGARGRRHVDRGVVAVAASRRRRAARRDGTSHGMAARAGGVGDRLDGTVSGAAAR